MVVCWYTLIQASIFENGNKKLGTPLSMSSRLCMVCKHFVIQWKRVVATLRNHFQKCWPFADSVVFRCKKDVDPGLKIHSSIFGYFKREVPEGQRIKIFVTMGSKNYSYDLEDLLTGKIVGRITKVRGLCLRGQVLDVQAIQENKHIEKSVKQFRMRINNASKTITATEVKSLYTNFSNSKRYYKSSTKSTKLWPYGTTSYQTL